MSYFKSDRVRVFPCSYRGNKQTTDKKIGSAVYNPTSRMLNEYNFIHSASLDGSNNTYIISYTEPTGNSYNLACVIAGYYFEINTTSVDLNNKYLYINILQLGDSETGSKVLAPIDSESVEQNFTLDTDEGEFTGLGIFDNPQNRLRGGLQIKINGEINSGAYLTLKDLNGNFKQNSAECTVINTAKFATAIGKNTTVSGIQAIACGEDTEATGTNSIAAGKSTKVTGKQSIVIGTNTRVTGDNSLAIGNGSSVIGNASIAGGTSTSVDGTNNIAFGNGTSVTGSVTNSAVAFGIQTNANTSGQFVIGKYNKNDSNSLFIIGNGTETSKANALTVTNNKINNNVAVENNSTTTLNGKLTVTDNVETILNGKLTANKEAILGPTNNTISINDSGTTIENKTTIKKQLTLEDELVAEKQITIGSNTTNTLTAAINTAGNAEITSTNDLILTGGTKQITITNTNVEVSNLSTAGTITTTDSITTPKLDINGVEIKGNTSSTSSKIINKTLVIGKKDDTDPANNTEKITLIANEISLKGATNITGDYNVIGDIVLDTPTKVNNESYKIAFKYNNNQDSNTYINRNSDGNTKLNICSAGDIYLNTYDSDAKNFKDLSISLTDVNLKDRKITTTGNLSANEADITSGKIKLKNNTLTIEEITSNDIKLNLDGLAFKNGGTKLYSSSRKVKFDGYMAWTIGDEGDHDLYYKIVEVGDLRIVSLFYYNTIGDDQYMKIPLNKLTYSGLDWAGFKVLSGTANARLSLTYEDQWLKGTRWQWPIVAGISYDSNIFEICADRDNTIPHGFTATIIAYKIA